LGLYEVKMIQQFDHRWQTFEHQTSRLVSDEEKRDTAYFVQPRHFVPTDQVMIRMTSAPAQVVKAYRKADFNELRLALLTWFTGYLVANPVHSESHSNRIVWTEVIG